MAETEASTAPRRQDVRFCWVRSQIASKLLLRHIPWRMMSGETPSDLDLGKRSLKKAYSFTIENILANSADRRPQVLLPFCFRGILDCEPKAFCALGGIAAGTLQEDEEGYEAETDLGPCGCCCCSHRGVHSWQETANWLGNVYACTIPS